MEKQKLKFGFNTIKIGAYCLYTCKIAIKNWGSTPCEIDGVSIYTNAKSMLVFEFVTTSANESSRMIKEIGKILYEHQKNKLKTKYGWAVPEEYEPTPEEKKELELQPW